MSERARRHRPQRHHALFGVALVLLVLLGAWWTIFLARSVAAEDEYLREQLWLKARLRAAVLALSPASVRAGPLTAAPGEPELEVVELSADNAPCRIAGTALSVRPTLATFAEQEGRLARRQLMVLGEGTLLLVVVAACIGMLYRLVVAERRYRLDIEHFLSRVTHEMKTPLAGMKALLQTLGSGQLPEARLQELTELGLRQAERQEHLIENMLSANRVAAGSAPLPISVLDLRDELEAFVAHRRATMGASEDSHALRCTHSHPVSANADALATILENLADNAEKYGASRVWVETADEGNDVQVRIHDDGQGFDEETAASMFNAFRRGRGNGGTGRHGTGLGLWISRELAREMGGDLTAKSEGPDRGSAFTLTLPGGSP